MIIDKKAQQVTGGLAKPPVICCVYISLYSNILSSKNLRGLRGQVFHP